MSARAPRSEAEGRLIRLTRLGYLVGWERKRSARGAYYEVEFASTTEQGRVFRSYTLSELRAFLDGLDYGMGHAEAWKAAARLKGR
jgi:hypothetical protein